MEGLYSLTTLVVVYLFITGYLGYRGFRGTKNAKDYLLAGAKTHPFVMALSYGATFISTSAIVGFGGAAAVFGLGLLWLTVFNIFVGIFIAFVFFGGRTRAMGHHLGAHTFPEFLGKRFDSKGLQVFIAFVIILFMPLYTGVVLVGAAKFIEVRVGVSYEAALLFFSAIVALYVIAGGMKAVMYTDAFQGVVMLVGMSILLFFAYSRLGGITEAHQSLGAMKEQAMAVFGPGGHQGWTAMPVFGSPMWWQLVSTIVLGVGIGVLAQPQLVVRYMTVKSKRELNRAVVAGGLFILMMTGVAFVTGALSNVYFEQSEKFGSIAIVAAAKDVDQIIPLYVKNFMPLWFGDVFMITLLAAAMSTASSQLHTMGAAVGRDVYQNLKSGSQDGHSILPTRAGVLLALLISIFLAYYLPRKFQTGTAIIARGTAIFFGLCAASFLPMYIGGLYSRAITKAGAITGAFVGFAVTAFWTLFVHIKESEILGLSQVMFNKPSILHKVTNGIFVWQEVDAIVIALPLAILATFLVSFMTKPYSKEHLDNCFSKVS